MRLYVLGREGGREGQTPEDSSEGNEKDLGRAIGHTRYVLTGFFTQACAGAEVWRG